MHEMYSKYIDRVDFLIVYVSEAHAVDQWKLGDKIKIYQHKTLNDRIVAAKSFKDENDIQLPVVVDSFPENQFDKEFACWPERGYIISQEKLAYISKCDVNGSMDWEDGVEKWLQEYFE